MSGPLFNPCTPAEAEAADRRRDPHYWGTHDASSGGHYSSDPIAFRRILDMQRAIDEFQRWRAAG